MLPPLIIAAAMAQRPARVALSGETISDLQFDPTNAKAEIRVNSDGTIDKILLGGTTQIDAATDWIIPNGRANVDYDVRVTGVTGDAWTTSPGADGTWFDLGFNRTWGFLTSAIETLTATFTLEIRDPAGITVASTSYTVTATRAA